MGRAVIVKDKMKMIVYYTVTSYHILKSAIHKLVYHRDDKAVILIPSFLVRMPYGFVNKDNNSIFSKVIVYSWETDKYENYPEDVFKNIELTMEKEMGENWISKIDEIDVFQAAYFFGAYLVDRKIKFNWFEDADGRFSDCQHVMDIDKRIAPERFTMAKRLGLYTGDNEYIEKKYFSYRMQKCDFNKKDSVDFDTKKSLESINVRPLLDLFGVSNKKTDIPENSALILSQHFCNLGMMSLTKQIYMYQQLLDYFLPNYKNFIKLHPSDKVEYDKYIKNVEVLDEDYPGELLRYSLRGKFEMLISVSSTGIRNMEDISKNQMILNDEYIRSFIDNDLYHFICNVIKLYPDYKVYGKGINIEQLQAMLQLGFNISNVGIYDMENLDGFQPSIIILGEPQGERILEKVLECKKNYIIILINAKTIVKKSGNCLKQSKIVKVIKTRFIEDKNRKSDKYIYIMSDMRESIKRIRRIKYNNFLENTKSYVKASNNIVDMFKFKLKQKW